MDPWNSAVYSPLNLKFQLARLNFVMNVILEVGVNSVAGRLKKCPAGVTLMSPFFMKDISSYPSLDNLNFTCTVP